MRSTLAKDDVPTGTGKTTAHTDTYRGCFVQLVPDERVVEVDEFETEDPALRGEMTITITLADGGLGCHRFDLWRHQRIHFSTPTSAAKSASRPEPDRCPTRLRRPHEGGWRSTARSWERYNDPRHVLGRHYLRVRDGRRAASLDPRIVRRGRGSPTLRHAKTWR